MAYHELNLTNALFHYTSAEAFQLIAASGKMRFSRADQTNDPFELVYVRDFILGALRLLAEEAADELEAGFWQSCRESYETVSQPSRFFISCFSKRKDSLPMWRLYSNEGTGVVFGLRPRAFDAFDCRLNTVDYLSENVDFAEHVRGISAKSYGEVLSPELGLSQVPFIVRLIEATTATKRAHWDYEQEVRLSFSLDDEQYASIKGLVDPVLLKRMSGYAATKASSSNDKQFLFQRFGKVEAGRVDRSGSLSELILGPNCEWGEEAAYDFLYDHGYRNVSVSRSSVNWR